MREGSVGGTAHGRYVSGVFPARIPADRTGNADGADPAIRPEGGPAGAGGRALGEDMLAFRRLYDSAGEGAKGSPEEGARTEGAPETPVRPEPAAPFPMPWAGAVWAGPGMPEPGAAGAQAAAPADVSLPELATELIGRLLVKDGEAPAAGQEIRILLKHCALEGTEVHFRRGEDGLHLLFLPDSPAGGDLLRRKSDSLESLLKARLSTEGVKVSVLDEDGTHRPVAEPKG